MKTPTQHKLVYFGYWFWFCCCFEKKKRGGGGKRQRVLQYLISGAQSDIENNWWARRGAGLVCKNFQKKEVADYKKQRDTPARQSDQGHWWTTKHHTQWGWPCSPWQIRMEAWDCSYRSQKDWFYWYKRNWFLISSSFPARTRLWTRCSPASPPSQAGRWTNNNYRFWSLSGLTSAIMAMMAMKMSSMATNWKWKTCLAQENAWSLTARIRSRGDAGPDPEYQVMWRPRNIPGCQK